MELDPLFDVQTPTLMRALDGEVVTAAEVSPMPASPVMDPVVTGNVVPGNHRNVGKDSIAHASDAHSDRMARFSLRLSDGSSTTSCGKENG